jgi:hypothetical protein
MTDDREVTLLARVFGFTVEDRKKYSWTRLLVRVSNTQ